MQINFLYHILISGCIFYCLTAGAKIFLTLRWSLDFSYLWVILFGSYVWVLSHLYWWRGMLAALGFSFLLSLFFTLFVLYLSSRLAWLYFSIWTLTLYMLFYQLAFNLKFITWGAFGLTGMGRDLVASISVSWLLPYLYYVLFYVLCVVGMLIYFKKTVMYTILQWWGEREVVIKSLGIQVVWYRLLMIAITTFLAVLGGNLYSFYYSFIDPNSFWLPFLVLLLVLVFGSYKLNEIMTFLFVLSIICIYEWLRFFKIVDPAHIWYVRELVFGILILIVSVWVSKNPLFTRQ
jgi:branched-chain amino acid transport system permease protein